MILQQLIDKGLITPPKWLMSNTHYLVVMGSRAYGVNTDKSDFDIYGFAVPPKRLIWPAGVPGFGSKPPGFDQYIQTHVRMDTDEFDFRIMSIVKYFDLCLKCNPDVIDSLFVPQSCVLHASPLAYMVRDQRHRFLNRKDVWRAYSGYAKSQLHKLDTKQPIGGRVEAFEREGFDRKFAYHGVRLLDEAEQILTTGTLDLRHAQSLLLDIRKDGGMPLTEILKWVASKENDLQAAYERCILPDQRPEVEILSLLYDCLEEAFGSVNRPDKAQIKLNAIRALLDD